MCRKYTLFGPGKLRAGGLTPVQSGDDTFASRGRAAKGGSYSSRRLISPTPPWTSRLIVCGDLP